jgi:hypothetical protein
MNNSQEQEYSGFIISKELQVKELTEDWSQEWTDKADLTASIQRFVKMVNEEIQESCPGAVDEYEILWNESWEKSGFIVSSSAGLDEDEIQRKSDAKKKPELFGILTAQWIMPNTSSR